MSDYKSALASVVCTKRDVFANWVVEVSAEFPPKPPSDLDTCLPDDPSQSIQRMVEESSRIPGWLFDKDSDSSKLLTELYRIQLTALHGVPSGTVSSGEPTDPTSSSDLLHAFHHIHYICQRHRTLQYDARYSKHSDLDLRQPLDRLAAHVWGMELGTGDGYVFRSECTVKLPKTKMVPILDATIDSGLFLFLPEAQYVRDQIDLKLRQGLYCTRDEYKTIELLHWVMEYKTELSSDVRRQVYYGMVSSLWQRRAMGVMDDFVFGSAQGGAVIEVYAARWEKLPVNEDAITDALAMSDLGHEPASASPPIRDMTRSNSRNVTQIGAGSVMSGSPNPHTGRVGELPKNDEAPLPLEKAYQIKVYRIGVYKTAGLIDMTRLYLLMRASCKLADHYRKVNLPTTVASLVAFEENVIQGSNFDWPSPPRKQNSKISTHDSEREPGTSGEQDTAYVADPNDETQWECEWQQDMKDELRDCGEGSLEGFSTKEMPEMTPYERVYQWMH